jgi:PAS domain S-box-containing protein
MTPRSSSPSNEITQQKQAEAALRDSQLRYRALYNTAPLAFILWDREGRITEWNRRAEQMFGWQAGEVIGKPVHRLLLSAERHPAFSDAVRGAMHGTGDGTFAGPAIGKDGRCLECNWYNVALRTQNGKLIGILSLVLDVTDERLAHQQLEKSEKVYRTLVETSPDAILLLGMDGRVKMANQQASRLFGLDELADLDATNIRELLPAIAENQPPHADFLDHPEDFTGFIASRQLSMQSREGLRFEAGTSFSTIMDSSGRSSGIVLFVRDITEKLRAERELEAHRIDLERLVTERTAELEGAHDTLAKIIDSSPVPAFVIDANHVVTHWNRACEQIIGVPADDILGTRNQWRAFYPAQRPIMADLVITGEMSLIQKLYSNKYRKSLLIEGAFEAEDYFPAFDRWLFFTAAPLRDKHGQIIGAIETLQDITERKLAEIALTDAKRAAEAATQCQDGIPGQHEPRNPHTHERCDRHDEPAAQYSPDIRTTRLR